MLCEHCKMREATVKYVEVINGVKTEHNLCAHCAGRVDIGQYSALFEGEFPLGKLLSGLLGMQDTEKDEGRYAGVVCPTCGTTYEDFVKDSQFGCPDCYSVFDPLIGENIKHLQGNERHVGKRPKSFLASTAAAEAEKAGTTEGAGETSGSGEAEPKAQIPAVDRLRLLQARLKDAVRREEYEEAAALRDEIHKLKEETKQNDEMV